MTVLLRFTFILLLFFFSLCLETMKPDEVLVFLPTPHRSQFSSSIFNKVSFPIRCSSTSIWSCLFLSYCSCQTFLPLRNSSSRLLSRYLHLRLLLLTLRNCQVSSVLIFFNSYKLSEPLIAFLSLSLECHSQLLLHLQIFTFFCHFVELCLS